MFEILVSSQRFIRSAVMTMEIWYFWTSIRKAWRFGHVQDCINECNSAS